LNHIALTSIPSNGQSVSLKASGSLTIHGITRPVTFDFTASYGGSVVQGTGSATILASDWAISPPFGIGNDEVIEFLVVLARS
jgi:polyisoprenoid-binding protein YceI